MTKRKNPHAAALGRLGGLRNTAAQHAARKANGAKGGRPRKDGTPVRRAEGGAR